MLVSNNNGLVAVGTVTPSCLSAIFTKWENFRTSCLRIWRMKSFLKEVAGEGVKS